MTEPMSDERLAEIGRCFLQLGFIPDSVGQELLDEVVRTRDIPPDVQAAMERYAKRLRDDTASEQCIGDLFTLGRFAVEHFGLFPVVNGQGVGE